MKNFVTLTLMSLLLFVGCGKKNGASTPAGSPPAAAPVAASTTKYVGNWQLGASHVDGVNQEVMLILSENKYSLEKHLTQGNNRIIEVDTSGEYKVEGDLITLMPRKGCDNSAKEEKLKTISLDDRQFIFEIEDEDTGHIEEYTAIKNDEFVITENVSYICSSDDGTVTSVKKEDILF